LKDGLKYPGRCLAPSTAMMLPVPTLIRGRVERLFQFL